MILDELWEDVRGENGGGIKALSEQNHKDIQEIKSDVSYIKGSIDGHMGTEKPSREEIVKQRMKEARVIGLIVLGGVVVIALVMLLVAKIILPEDVINAIRAWKGGV